MTTYIHSSFIPFHLVTGEMAPIGVPVCSDKEGSLVFVQHIAVHKEDVIHHIQRRCWKFRMAQQLVSYILVYILLTG
jgi:hypothetical protein